MFFITVQDITLQIKVLTFRKTWNNNMYCFERLAFRN